MRQRIPLELTHEDREALKRLVRMGTEKARVIRRANVLLMLSQEFTKKEICKAIGVGDSTVRRVKGAYETGGMEQALYEKARSGRPATYDAKVKKKIIALACSKPPQGHAVWTLALLSKHSGIEPKPSRNTVSLMLKEDGIKPWQKKNVVRTQGG